MSLTKPLVFVIALCSSAVLAAQSAPPPAAGSDARGQSFKPDGRPQLSPIGAGPDSPASKAARHCDGCPARRPGRAFLEATAINGAYGLANLVRGQVTARVTPTTWWRNLESGWVWDLDQFLVNQIGHPYQGAQYFSAGRANGLGFYESAAVAAFGSGTWEYFGETNHPSLNDFINTTMGGVALGEMLHRTAWLVRDPRATGRRRRWREVAAAAIDPVTGLNRLMTDDASRLAGLPDGSATRMGGVASMGILRRGNNVSSRPTTIEPFLQVDLTYGDTEVGRSRTPFDAFGVRFMAGGGGALSEARVRGRLLGEPMLNDRMQLSLVQSYHYLGNEAYRFGAQAFEAHLGGRRAVSSQLTLTLVGWGGITVLGAIDSRPFTPASAPADDREPARQGVSEGSRNYDYGPGTTFGASATLLRSDQPLVTAQYEGRTLYSLDGVRANHVLQRGRVDVMVPVRGRLGVGATGEFFDRHSFYQDAAETIRRYSFPQARLYLTWRLP
jgi:hypothetical protein